MPSNPDDAVPDVASSITVLEKLSQGRVLILLLSFCFYLDTWLIAFNNDPATMTISASLSAAKSVPILTVAIFLLSYSLLMGLIFPVVRKLIGATRILIQQNLTLVKTEREESLLADWSLSVVALAGIDAFMGWRAPQHAYKGFVLFVGNVLAPDHFIINVARVCIGLCCLACLTLAFTVDG